MLLVAHVDGAAAQVCQAGGIGGVAAPAGERGQRSRDRLLQRRRDRWQIEELARERAREHRGLQGVDAPLGVDLPVVGEPEQLREEFGQAQSWAELGDEARRLVGFDDECVGRVGRDDECLAGAHPSARAADATDDLALENLKALFLAAVAMQRSAAAAWLHDRLGSQDLTGGGRLDVHHAVDAEPLGVDRVEPFEQELRCRSRGCSHDAI